MGPGIREKMKSALTTLARGGITTDYTTLFCFVDYSTTEYFLGNGPTRLTLVYDIGENALSYGLYRRAHQSGAYGDESLMTEAEHRTAFIEQPIEDAETMIKDSMVGRESVLFLVPLAAHSNITLEVWQVVAQWDLQTVGGELNAVRYGVADDYSGHTQTYSGLKLRTTTKAGSDAFADKRIASTSGLNQYYRELGAYKDITLTDGNKAAFAPSLPIPAQACEGSAALSSEADRLTVRDCSALLAVRDTLAGTASLNWSNETAIGNWTGITSGASPTRVTEISLSNSSLSGSVPGRLSHLQSLTTLDLSENQLTGSIPGQLAKLPALATLRLSGNPLTGCIPAGLRDVATHDLASLNLPYCDATAPDPMATFTARANGETSVRLAWTAPDDNHGPITGYELQRGTGVYGPWADILPAQPADVNIFILTGLEKNTTYYFRIRAVNAAGKGQWGKVAGARTQLLSPALVTGMSATPAGSSGITVNWDPRAEDDDNSISGYRLQRRTETVIRHATGAIDTTQSKWADVSPAPGADATSYTDTGLRQNTTYAYRMRALNARGTSRWSAAASATTGIAPPVPSGLTVSLSNGVFTLAWAEHGDLVKFEVEQRRAATDQWAALPEVTGTSTTYTPEALPTCADAWQFRLRGFGDGESHAAEWSGWLSPVAYTSAAINNPQNFPGLVRDCNILLQGKNTLRGTATSLNWGIERNMGRWTGFGAGDGVDGVHSLYLGDLGLNGSIPAGFGGLAELYRLDLSDNQLTGAIPSTFSSLTKLELMYLGNNQLTGSLPAELGSMTSLKELSTYGNASITGSIPAELGNLSNLRRLELTNNNLTGQIPTEFGKLKKLETLRMSHNALTGSIPSELGDLPVLHELLVNSNQFGGCIPRNLMDISTNDLSSPGMPGFCPAPASEQ